VTPERVIILAETAERPDEIDRNGGGGARRARRAEQRMTGRDPDGAEGEKIDYDDGGRGLPAGRSRVCWSSAIGGRLGRLPLQRGRPARAALPSRPGIFLRRSDPKRLIRRTSGRWHVPRTQRGHDDPPDRRRWSPRFSILVRFTLEDPQVRIVEGLRRAAAAPRPRTAGCGRTWPLLDVKMPRLSGLDVCRRLPRAAGVRATTRRSCLLTAAAQAEDRRRGLAAGADHYLTKPFSPLAPC